MKLSNTLIAIAAITRVGAVPIPRLETVALGSRSQEGSEHNYYSEHSDFQNLWRRKGGSSSGGHGGGSRGGSSSGTSSGSSGSLTSSGTSSGGRGSSSSSTGGSTTIGSGPKPAYGSGSSTYYGGGARTPYTAGGRSPNGIVPGLLIGSSLGFWGRYWALGAYSYPYTHPYSYHNTTSNQNETKPVNCLCRPDSECGCDDNTDQIYFDSVIGNGSYVGLNKTLVNVATVNGTDTIFLNGTLPNGTTSSGGTEEPFATGAAEGLHSILRATRWWPLVATSLALTCLA